MAKRDRERDGAPAGSGAAAVRAARSTSKEDLERLAAKHQEYLAQLAAKRVAQARAAQEAAAAKERVLAKVRENALARFNLSNRSVGNVFERLAAKPDDGKDEPVRGKPPRILHLYARLIVCCAPLPVPPLVRCSRPSPSRTG